MDDSGTSAFGAGGGRGGVRPGHVLIVGAGLAGCATAWWLAQLEIARKVTLIETERLPGQHASSQNAAMVRQIVSSPVTSALAVEGAAFVRSPPKSWRGPLDFRRVGSLLLACGQDWCELLEAAQRAHHFGAHTVVLSVEEACRRVPLLRGASFDGALYSPDDGVLDVNDLMRGLVDGARDHGVDVRLQTRAMGLSHSAGVVDGVHTSQGRIDADVVVNAAGAWAPTLTTSSSGRGALLRPHRRHLFVTPPMQEVDPNWPYVWQLSDGVYMRPESGGLLLSACDEEMVPAGSPQVAPGATMHLAEKVTRTFPTLGQVGVRRSWAGLRTFAPDREFVVGYDDDRLFWVAGLGGHGVTTCVAVGRLAARAIAGEVEPPAALLPTSPAPGARDGHWQPPSFAGRETA